MGSGPALRADIRDDRLSADTRNGLYDVYEYEAGVILDRLARGSVILMRSVNGINRVILS